MSSPNPLLETARAIARDVFAADLGDTPLYIVQPEMGEHVGGFYSPTNDAIFRRQIEAAGEWRGPGVCVAVCTDTLEYQGLDDHDRERWIIGVVLHELTHWVDYPAERVQPREITTEQATVTWQTIQARLADDQPVSRLAWIYRTHGQSFTRLACHVWHRANRLFPLIPDSICFGSSYPSLWLLERPRTYIDALRSELNSYPGNSPLRPLSWTIEAPEPYVDLWRSSLFAASSIAHALNGESS